MGKWEKLCRSLKPLLGSKKDVPESVFEETFVMALEDIFGWDKSSIEQQTQFAIGSAGQLRPDIILNGNDFGIVIEMKSPSVLLEEVKISQIMSYM